MAYEFDNQARDEAAHYTLSDDKLVELRAQVKAKLAGLGPDGVRAHRVSYKPDRWAGLIPAPLTGATVISRGDVFDLAAGGDLTAVLAASFLWGSGKTGYGPHRLRDIVDSTDGRLSEMLAAAVDAASEDVMAGYAMFYGGYDYKTRTAPNTAPWTRIDGLGPAFFTKFLYFTTPGALILDRVLARKVHSLSGMPYLVDSKGNSLPWSPYRYSVYLHWMRQTADRIVCAADELEVTLFVPPRLT
ncbi:hypothetical protein [Mycolicibacterium mageritense]|uniref:8-oxoguanine DNA glycosylase OGG fold protein n=1 Tax=Mycolicibacterium mageritense TaxID=53462 RepID=UPI0011D3388C|nr:hypothetical protein [Mycolicibacterium mageritense]TXI54392.1 MAG: hypothetical protein E6Q55_32830 [Mycolicibacterium mageritense]